MRWVTPEEVASQIASLEGREPLALIFDYDGTLAEIAPRPELARIEQQVHARLSALARHSDVRVGLITGRAIESLTELAGPSAGMTLATNGGLRITDEGDDWISPEAAQRTVLLRNVIDRIAPVLERWPGTFIEDKTLSFTVHFRQVPAAEGAITSAVLAAVDHEAGLLRTLPAKYGIEVQPNISWDKGHALLWMLDRWGIRQRAAFFGDDVIDEPAFVALNTRAGITCCVTPEQRPTAARFALKTVSELSEVLRLLNASFGPRPS